MSSNIFSYPEVIPVLLFKFVLLYFLFVQIFLLYMLFFSFQLALRCSAHYITINMLCRIFESRVLLPRTSRLNCNTVPIGSILTRKPPGYLMFPCLFSLYVCVIVFYVSFIYGKINIHLSIYLSIYLSWSGILEVRAVDV